MSIVRQHFERLKEHPRFERAELTGPHENGTFVVKVPGVALPPGWNQPSTTVYFVVPIGYPTARPDTFWTDRILLESGSPPQSSGQNQVPGVPADSLWFSWHPQAWRPNEDTLLTYLRMVLRRLREPR